MQKDNRFFDDMAKLAGGAAGGILSMKQELEAHIRAQVEKLLQHFNFATKEEYDTLAEMVVKLRNEQEEMKKKLEALEAQNRP